MALTQWLSQSALIAIPAMALFFSTLQTALVFYLGRILWNPSVGLVAAGLDTMHPLNLLWSTQALPDPVLACCSTAALLFFVLGQRSGSLLHFALAGACVGAAYTAKVSGLFTLPIFCLLWFFTNHNRSPSQLVALGFGAFAVLVLETLTLSYLGEQFIARPLLLLNKSSNIYSDSPEHIAIGFDRYFPGFLASQFWPFDRGFPFHAFFGPFALYFAVSALSRPGRASMAERTVAWWWFGLLLLTNFAAFGFASPLVPTVQMRYLMYITTPACLLLGARIVQLSAPWRHGALIAFLTSSLFCAYIVYGTWAPYNDAYRNLIQALDEHSTSGATVFFHEPDSADRLNLLVDSERTHTYPTQPDQWQPHPGDMAVIFISAYTPEEQIPHHYTLELNKTGWQLKTDWSSSPGLASRLLSWSDVEVKKGLDTRFRLYLYTSTAPTR